MLKLVSSFPKGTSALEKTVLSLLEKVEVAVGRG